IDIVVMANDQLKPIASLLLLLNFCLYIIVAAIGGWALNRAINHGFIIVVGAASALAGINHIRLWHADSLPSAASVAIMAWSLTILAMGLAWKEIELNVRNARLKTMEAFLIILTATQFLYILAIHGASSVARR
ncbi:hypothetical protein IFM89_028655, partial [Coptis chinensis]